MGTDSKEVSIPEIEPMPDDDLIFNAMRGMSREAQAILTKTVWKDGIDLEEPNAGCKSFVSRITEPYRVRLSKAESELQAVRAQKQDLERALLLASNEPELRPMMPDAWIIRWMGKVVAFRASDTLAARSSSAPQEKK